VTRPVMMRFWLLMLVSLLGACAHVPGPDASKPAAVQADARQWHLSGRFVAGQSGAGAADSNNEPIAGRFAWQHESASDTLWLIGPLGNAMARVDITPAGVRWQDASGKRGESSDLRSLGESLAGIRLPDVAADAWLRARWPGQDVRARDTTGRILQAAGGGWVFDYRYGMPAPDNWPLAIEGRGPGGLWLKVALTEWNGVSDPAEQPTP
jgi:outer membrane biogenesis lipoprotein LolB